MIFLFKVAIHGHFQGQHYYEKLAVILHDKILHADGLVGWLVVLNLTAL